MVASYAMPAMGLPPLPFILTDASAEARPFAAVSSSGLGGETLAPGAEPAEGVSGSSRPSS